MVPTVDPSRWILVRSLFAHFVDGDLAFSFSLLSITSARAGWVVPRTSMTGPCGKRHGK